MLILTRRPGEVIEIDGGKITVRVITIGHGQVRLGITAPDDVSVNRKEIEDRIRQGEIHAKGE